MVKTIPLTQGKIAIIDDDDYEKLNKFKWCSQKDHQYTRWYAIRKKLINGKWKLILMHREILKAKRGIYIDHINHNGLDNRKINLRLCTGSQNQKNRGLQKNNTSGLIGVSFNKEIRKWSAYIIKDKHQIFLGIFDDKEEAGHVVDKKAIELFGDFAILNFPKKKY